MRRVTVILLLLWTITAATPGGSREGDFLKVEGILDDTFEFLKTIPEFQTFFLARIWSEFHASAGGI